MEQLPETPTLTNLPECPCPMRYKRYGGPIDECLLDGRTTTCLLEGGYICDFYEFFKLEGLDVALDKGQRKPK